MGTARAQPSPRHPGKGTEVTLNDAGRGRQSGSQSRAWSWARASLHRRGAGGWCSDTLHLSQPCNAVTREGCISRSLMCRTRKVMLCWLPVFVPTCSVDQVNWLICLEVGCQALMALDKQPVQCFALQPFWGLPQVLLSWPRSGQRG